MLVFPSLAIFSIGQVRVCRRIEEGDEIVASYLAFAELPLRQTRRDMLRPWGFECRLGPKSSSFSTSASSVSNSTSTVSTGANAVSTGANATTHQYEYEHDLVRSR